MCVNLFAPLALDRELGAVLATSLLDGRRIRRLHDVVFEHAPAPKADYLDDATSFDAFLDVEDDGGQRGFVVIETKLTEPFSVTRYRIEERPAYRRWVDRADGPWAGVAYDALDARAHNQLWRNHALAYALRVRQAERYAFGTSVVVHHPLDARCAEAVSAYRVLVRAPEVLPVLARPLDAVVRRFREGVRGTRFEGWLSAFEERYLEMAASAEMGKGARR